MFPGFGGVVVVGFGGHFLSKGRHGIPTFSQLRDLRITWRRATDAPTSSAVRVVDHMQETTLLVGALSFAGVGWHNTGDAALAATSAAMARARRDAARDALSTFDRPMPAVRPAA